jgi:predicted DNA-binding transcriptional regulator AlpA
VVTKRFVVYQELTDFGVPQYSRKHLIDLQRRGQFPRAYQLSPNRVAWLEEDIKAWLASRPFARSAIARGEDAA